MNLQLGGGATSTLSALVQPGARGQWLIAGTQFRTGGATRATLWSSPDALSWSKTELPLPSGATTDEADAVTNWGQREVVVGSAGSGAVQRAAVWVSRAPGQPFVAITDSPVFGPPSSTTPISQPGAAMDTVAAGALGLFAAGTLDGQAAVWYSTNGLQWDALSGADKVIDGEPGAVVNDILSTPGGVFAAGSTVNGNRLSAALWYSSDGIHWEVVQDPGPIFFGAGDHVITSLVNMADIGSSVSGGPAPTGLLAVGGVRVGSTWQPASWISPDGFSWSQTSESFPLDSEPADSPGALAYSATGADGLLYAAGGSPGRQRLWQSDDGLAWTAVALPPAAASDTTWHLGLAAAEGHTTVLADNLPGQPYVLVREDGSWHEPSGTGVFGNPLPTAWPTSLVSDNGQLVMSVQLLNPGQVLGNASSSVAVLTSTDGASWQTSNVDAFQNSTVNQLLPVPAGLLAVGAHNSTVGQRHQAVSSWTDAFASLSGDDGITWPREPISPATLGDPPPNGPPTTTTSTTTTTTAPTGSTTLAGSATPTGSAAPTGSTTSTGSASATSTALPTSTAPPTSTGVSPASSTSGPGSSSPRGAGTTAIPAVTTTGSGAAATTTTSPSATTTTTTVPHIEAPLAGPFTATAAGRVGNSLYVVGQAGPQAVGWFSPDGATWQRPQALDATPQLATEQARATCVAANSAVVVGSETTTGQGALPAAWSSTDGSSWTSATFSTGAAPGSYTQVDGCLFTGNSFIAYGGSTGNGQTEQPVLWGSADGTSWAELSTTFSGLSGGSPVGLETAPLDGVAEGTTTWLGVSGDGDAPAQVWPAPVGGEAGAIFTPAGLWSSVDAGATWQQLDTSTPAFSGTVFAQALVAAYVGQRPVIAGTVDGQLAVWVGRPASGPAGNS
ncbi:MAG: hypothetical protein ACLQVK_02625 [Acidimicrobiales bacterium]